MIDDRPRAGRQSLAFDLAAQIVTAFTGGWPVHSFCDLRVNRLASRCVEDASIRLFFLFVPAGITFHEEPFRRTDRRFLLDGRIRPSFGRVFRDLARHLRGLSLEPAAAHGVNRGPSGHVVGIEQSALCQNSLQEKPP